MKKKVIIGCLLASLSISSLFAAEPAKKAKGNELERATCGMILDLFAAAHPQSTRDKKDLAAAQDQTFIFVMWAHGYLSGRDGIDFAKRPMNQAGISQVVADINKVCKDDEQKSFLEAVKGIR